MAAKKFQFLGNNAEGQKRLFAFSKLDGRFVVAGDGKDQLRDKLLAMRDNYEKYYRNYVAPGLITVKAQSLRNAKVIAMEEFNRGAKKPAA